MTTTASVAAVSANTSADIQAVIADLQRAKAIAQKWVDESDPYCVTLYNAEADLAEIDAMIARQEARLAQAPA